MISNFGYTVRKEDSRFENILLSIPFSGLSIETPGADFLLNLADCEDEVEEGLW